MKKTFLIITAFLFITSTAFPQAKMDMNNLMDRGGLLYAPNKEKPFSGSVFALYDDGQKKLNGRYRNGLKNGKWEWWSATGVKDSVGTYKNAIKHGKWTYLYENGQKWKEGTYKDGKKYKNWKYWNKNGKLIDSDIVGTWELKFDWKCDGLKIGNTTITFIEDGIAITGYGENVTWIDEEGTVSLLSGSCDDAINFYYNAYFKFEEGTVYYLLVEGDEASGIMDDEGNGTYDGQNSMER